jgi:hypothetical protein
MLNPIEVLADALGNHLAVAYTRAFSGREPRYTAVIAEAAGSDVRLACDGASGRG